MKINFLGAARSITGSKHLIQTEGFNLLLDCGFCHGRRQEANRKNKELPFKAADIDAVILSHAHLDHCGTLPVLVKNGYRGRIYCTKATAEIAKCILLDSAGIQEQDAEYLNRHSTGGENVVPLYTKEDVEKTVEFFEPVEYFRKNNKWTDLNENIRFALYDAGHILGSAVVVLEIKENGKKKTITFTGDLGREFAPILRSPEDAPDDTQVLISECTYGDRNHRPVSEATAVFKEAVQSTIKDKSKIIIPAFSLGRTQEIIYILHKLIDDKEISPLQIYVDSPLAQNITEIFPKFKSDFDSDFWNDFGNKGQSPFLMENLHYIRSTEESKSLNEKQGPMMIISASGMAEGGRVLHHLKNNIGDPQNIIMMVGYQAEHTLGRRIQEGQSPVKIFGEYYNSKAQIKTLDEFSAHAGQEELLAYALSIKNLQKVFLVHTENRQSQIFKNLLEEKQPSLVVEIPGQGESFEV